MDGVVRKKWSSGQTYIRSFCTATKGIWRAKTPTLDSSIVVILQDQFSISVPAFLTSKYKRKLKENSRRSRALPVIFHMHFPIQHLTDSGGELQTLPLQSGLPAHPATTLSYPARHAFIRCSNVLNAAGTYAEASSASCSSRSLRSQDALEIYHRDER